MESQYSLFPDEEEQLSLVSFTGLQITTHVWINSY